uniref:Uncharacterized protein n=1 Tax=Odontella aurita TaxID=265563 RepID=A0A7S4JYJ1_9STRA|mmetsp:Transcript_57304/g.170870  ORF Transcript_57304/g.170870 Transcript_57304/m.170870 type:complete len:133 (+) Transcript_57304:262-660(+)|eukprot:CAMPEP_0113561986 /NCGR_PEP_ID=MMETSP0015_2-20120614/20279_1 /TAXON_ID=2838 /ORGANISM="Odontella" /LENGTH=132 /DNA_ID=CAMNT_0000463839 /DNA_START=145 /DNA_END=543 /DNA_ORIENTATION=- /assembly_acc=CAM_ASM_000160
MSSRSISSSSSSRSNIPSSSHMETKQAQMKKQWSAGFSWADDSDSDDSDCDEFCEIVALSSCASMGSLKSSSNHHTPPGSPSSSRSPSFKSVRFAPLAEMRLIPSLPDLSAQVEGTQKPQVFVERGARTVIL